MSRRQVCQCFPILTPTHHPPPIPTHFHHHPPSFIRTPFSSPHPPCKSWSLMPAVWAYLEGFLLEKYIINDKSTSSVSTEGLAAFNFCNHPSPQAPSAPPNLSSISLLHLSGDVPYHSACPPPHHPFLVLAPAVESTTSTSWPPKHHPILQPLCSRQKREKHSLLCFKLILKSSPAGSLVCLLVVGFFFLSFFEFADT